jgi:hypothetical protein
MSMARCNGCDVHIDTDYHPSAFVADGEAVLCASCMEQQPVVLKALQRALKTIEKQRLRAERTDNAAANSGRLDVYVRRERELTLHIGRVKRDFDKWLETV